MRIIDVVYSCSHSGDEVAGDADRCAGVSEERLASDLASRLAVEFPTVDRDVIHVLIKSSMDRTRLARVRNYRLVLAEREARSELRRVVALTRAS